MTLGTVLARSPLPEVGQMVRVRGQHWVVSDVSASSLPLDVLASRAGAGHTLVRLSNVEDHGLGQELDVIWEVEPGREILDVATLPNLVRSAEADEPARLRAFLDAVRWGAVASADVRALQAPFRAGIQIEDYQLEPVTRAIRSPRANLLVADDVGLGKTIEAGLVAQELVLRHRARRIVIVCPADLTEKWQREMAEKFGMDFTIVDSTALKELRRSHGVRANPWRVWPRTIVSLPWLRGDRAQRLLREVLPPGGVPEYPRTFGLLILDEAHHCAPSAKGKYAVDSQQTKAMRQLAPHFEHRLFLSATPHNGYHNSFESLLELLDPQRFARGVRPRQELLDEVMVRRIKADIRNPDGTPRFAERQAEALEVAYSDDEREAHRLLAAYTDARRKRIRGAAAGQATDMIALLLKKRLFSSPTAFAVTLGVHEDTLARRATEEAEWEDEDDLPPWLVEARLRADEDRSDEEREEAEQDLLGQAVRLQKRPSPEELSVLRQMRQWADTHANRPDAKAERLIAWLEKTCRPDGRWNDERVVVFTEYRDTQKALKAWLDARGLGGDALRLLHGGMDDKVREHLKDAFQAPPDRDPVRVLIATDSASEGIDLQLHCHRIVNYDIPFNPNRLEQRIGRVDRYGQKHHVEVKHFVGTGWEDANAGSYERDLEFLSRVAIKVATIREDLGKVNSVLSAAVEQRMLGRGVGIDIERIDTAPTVRLARAELDLREQAKRLRDQLDESIDALRVQPDNIAHVVGTALALAHQPPLQPGTLAGTWDVPALTGSWATAALDLPHRMTGHRRPITFDAAVAAGQPEGDIVHVHLGHRLVAMATRLLRAEVWGGATSTLSRVAYCRVPDGLAEGPVLAAYSRLVLVGADGHRLHEEVFPAGGVLRDGRFSRLGVGALDRVLQAAFDPAATPVRSSVADTLADMWERVSGGLRGAIDARAAEREQSLRAKLDERRDDETRRITRVLDQLAQSIQDALREPESDQLSFWEDTERDQLKRDQDAWRLRLASVPEETARETELIRNRYATTNVLSFPAALLVCVPDSLAGDGR
jgi:superfamily II DNA or RNA helicase